MLFQPCDVFIVLVSMTLILLLNGCSCHDLSIRCLPILLLLHTLAPQIKWQHYDIQFVKRWGYTSRDLDDEQLFDDLYDTL